MLDSKESRTVFSQTVKYYNKQLETLLKIIISGGGTGGHVFPAIAIARALKEKVIAQSRMCGM